MSIPDHDWDAQIARFLAGEASPEEAIALHDWIGESEANRQTFEIAKTAWGLTGMDQHKKPDATAIFRRLKTETQSFRRYFTPLQIAASLLLGVCIAAGAYLVTRTTPQPEQLWITKTSKQANVAWLLPEGSIITLNSNSRLRYPKTFDHTRTVALTGEAFFTVKTDVAKPFIIVTDDVQVKVLGTEFNVSAHPADSLVRVQVVHGSVLMSHGTDSIVVQKDQKGFYRKSTQTLWIEETQTNNNLGYATHTFAYEDRSFRNILEELSAAYNVTFELSDPRVNDCHLTGEYLDMSLPLILEVVCHSLDLTYHINGNRVYISGDGCL